MKGNSKREAFKLGFIGTTIGEMELLEKRKQAIVLYNGSTYTTGDEIKSGRFSIKIRDRVIINGDVKIGLEYNTSTKKSRAFSVKQGVLPNNNFRIIPSECYLAGKAPDFESKKVQLLYAHLKHLYLYPNSPDIEKTKEKIGLCLIDEECDISDDWNEALQSIPEDGSINDELCLSLLRLLKQEWTKERFKPSLFQRVKGVFSLSSSDTIITNPHPSSPPSPS